MTHRLQERDLKHNWHPYTQMKECGAAPPIPIARAEGAKLYDYDGNWYYDTISSWWCNVHGHNHPYIKNAIKEQLDRLEHVLFAGFTHEPAIRLAEKLVEVTPAGLEKVFFSDNGSTAVETAMKMSYQYWLNTGREGRTKFLSLDMGYHGDTVGTMAVSGVDLFNKKFKPLFFESFKAPTPYKKDAAECLEAMEDILKEHSAGICAILIEPLLMGAAGMVIYPVEYLKGVARLARKYGVHLIVDEVATGFGRTGRMFASEYAAVEPDFMCLSKGITSGYMPMGATLTTKEIYDAFVADRSEYKTFYHGHTYTANPLACAAAIASLELFEKEDTLARVAVISRKLGAFLEKMSGLEGVDNVRGIGAVGAVEFKRDRGLEIYRKGLTKGLVLRPLGKVTYFFLPLCLKEDELDDIFCRAGEIMYNSESN